MASSIPLFWEKLETNFPLGGVRRRLGELVGADAVRVLEAAGVLRHQGLAERYPCPSPGGDGCPRQVVALAPGQFEAICGNYPPACPNVSLTANDLSFLAVVPEHLCTALARALQIRASVEAVPGCRDVFRVGSFMPEPGIKHTIYLTIRCSVRDYNECFYALKARATGTFAVLVPTDRFISEEAMCALANVAAPVVALVDAIGVSDSGLAPMVDPLRLLAGIGQHNRGPVAMAPSIVARALIRSGGGEPEWHALDKAGYERIVAASTTVLAKLTCAQDARSCGHGKRTDRHGRALSGVRQPTV